MESRKYGVKYPKSMVRYDWPLDYSVTNSIPYKEFCSYSGRFGDVGGVGMKEVDITDKNEVKRIISIIENRKNFKYLRNWVSLNGRTGFRYFFNGKSNCVCFDAFGHIERDGDSIFSSNKEVRKYLLSIHRLSMTTKDTNRNHIGIGPYPDSTYHLIHYYDTL